MLRNVLGGDASSLSPRNGIRNTAIRNYGCVRSGLLVGLGLIIGTICALIAIAPAAFARGAHLPGGALWYLLLAVVAAGLITSLLTVAALSRSRLLAALQSE
jgi:drug/metabolite transporter (DMT)-like permease